MARTAHIGTSYFRKATDSETEGIPCKEEKDEQFSKFRNESNNFLNTANEVKNSTEPKADIGLHVTNPQLRQVSPLNEANSGASSAHHVCTSGVPSSLHFTTSAKRSSGEFQFSSKRSRLEEENENEYAQMYRTGKTSRICKKTIETLQADDLEESVLSDEKTAWYGSVCAESSGSMKGIACCKQSQQPPAKINAITVVPGSAISEDSRNVSKMGTASSTISAGYSTNLSNEDGISAAHPKLCTFRNRTPGAAHSIACTISITNSPPHQLISDDVEDVNSKPDATSKADEMASSEKTEQVSYITLSCDTDPEISVFRRCESVHIEDVTERRGRPETPRQGFSHTIDSLVKER
jgi:hypothetical protein